jgi:hypothetical protein
MVPKISEIIVISRKEVKKGLELAKQILQTEKIEHYNNEKGKEYIETCHTSRKDR